jgi:acyl carrier protein
MTAVRPDDVRTFVTNFLREKLASQGQELASELPDDCDLLLSGFIDSLGLLELVTAMNRHYGREIDFEALEPEHMTVIGPLSRYVSGEMAKS